MTQITGSTRDLKAQYLSKCTWLYSPAGLFVSRCEGRIICSLLIIRQCWYSEQRSSGITWLDRRDSVCFTGKSRERFRAPASINYTLGNTKTAYQTQRVTLRCHMRNTLAISHVHHHSLQQTNFCCCRTDSRDIFNLICFYVFIFSRYMCQKRQKKIFWDCLRPRFLHRRFPVIRNNDCLSRDGKIYHRKQELGVNLMYIPRRF